MSTPHYERKAGNLDEYATQAKLSDLLRQAAEQAYMLGHFKKANGSELIGQGYLAIGQLLELTVQNITKLAMGKLIQ